jgi:hypothetical protein
MSLGLSVVDLNASVMPIVTEAKRQSGSQLCRIGASLSWTADAGGFLDCAQDVYRPKRARSKPYGLTRVTMSSDTSQAAARRDNCWPQSAIMKLAPHLLFDLGKSLQLLKPHL